MLARSGSPLPAEIYDLIYSDLNRADLTQLLRTCRLLFTFTVPHVWCKVDMVQLLTLLPGSYLEARDKDKILQVIPYSMLARYFNRFHIYAQHVKHLSTSPDVGIACDAWTESTRAGVQTYSSNFTMLPNLTEASLSFDEVTVLDQGHKEIEFWIQILISDKLQALTFRAKRPEDMHCFGNLLSRSPSLVRLNFQLAHRIKSDPWSSVSEYQVPLALKELDFASLELNHHKLLWVSRMLSLHKLRLALSSNYWDEPPEDLSGFATKHPVGSFHALKYLEVQLSGNCRGWGEVVQIWQTPLIANLTKRIIHQLPVRPVSGAQYQATSTRDHTESIPVPAPKTPAARKIIVKPGHVTASGVEPATLDYTG